MGSILPEFVHTPEGSRISLYLHINGLTQSSVKEQFSLFSAPPKVAEYQEQKNKLVVLLRRSHKNSLHPKIHKQ